MPAFGKYCATHILFITFQISISEIFEIFVVTNDYLMLLVAQQ